MSDQEPYSNVREILGKYIGRSVVDITQHDEEEFEVDGKSYVSIMFDSGDVLKFFIGDDGFSYTEDAPASTE